MPRNAKHVIGFVVLASLPAAACGNEVYLMSEHHHLTADGEDMLLATGCQSLSGDSGSTGAGFPSTTPNPDTFEIVEEAHDGGIVVIVRTSDGKTLARRAYSEDFAAEGREDAITVELPDGDSLRLFYWGGSRCGAPRPSAKD